MSQAVRNGVYGAFWRVGIFIFQPKICGSSRFSAPALCVRVCVRARAHRHSVCVESNGDSIRLVFFESFPVHLKLNVELSG